LSTFIGLCALYLALKHFKGGDGGDMTGGRTSGIEPDKGLISILPPKEEIVRDIVDFLWWGCWSLRTQFDASPGNGELGDRLLLASFCFFEIAPNP
jgi:hypothetical protein